MKGGKLKPYERKEWRSRRGDDKYPMRVGTWKTGATTGILMRGQRGGYYLKIGDGRTHRRYLPIKLVGRYGYFDKGKEPGGKLGERISKWAASVKRGDTPSVWSEIAKIRKGSDKYDREDEKAAEVDDFRSTKIREAVAKKESRQKAKEKASKVLETLEKKKSDLPPAATRAKVVKQIDKWDDEQKKLNEQKKQMEDAGVPTAHNASVMRKFDRAHAAQINDKTKTVINDLKQKAKNAFDKVMRFAKKSAKLKEIKENIKKNRDAEKQRKQRASEYKKSESGRSNIKNLNFKRQLRKARTEGKPIKAKWSIGDQKKPIPAKVLRKQGSDEMFSKKQKKKSRG